MQPGPVDGTLLSLQATHRSEELWRGRIPLGSTMKPQRVDDVWTILRTHPPHERIVEHLSRAGLHPLVRVGRVQFDRALLTAIIERWRPETHTFHLPFGEVTITLQDLQILFGLHINGRAVYVQDPSQRSLVWRTLLHELTGFLPTEEDMSGTSRVKVVAISYYLRNQLETDPIADDTPAERVERIARLYMVLIFGGILFPNTSGNLLSLRFLPFLDPIEDVGTYSWGSAVLAYLYRSLCRSSMGRTMDVGGFLPLLQIWCWERILPLQPVPIGPGVTDVPQDDEALIPYARRWTRGVYRDDESHHAILPIRDQLDHMTEDQFVWTPYASIMHKLPLCCTIDQLLWTARVPMICLEIVEHHAPDRAMRQFGHPQHIPVFPTWAPDHYAHDQRRRLAPAFLELLDASFDEWGHRNDRAVEVGDGVPVAAYRDWFQRYGRLLIGNPALHVIGGRGFVHSAGAHEAMARGLHRLYQLGLDWKLDPASAQYGQVVCDVVREILHEAGEHGRVDGAPFPGNALFEHPPAVRGGRGRGDARRRGRGDAQGRGCGERRGGRGRGRVGGRYIVGEPVETQIHTLGPSSIPNPACETTTEDLVQALNKDPGETQIHTSSPPVSSPEDEFIMPDDDIAQTSLKKKGVRRLIKRTKKNDHGVEHPSVKRKRDRDGDDGGDGHDMGLRSTGVLRTKGCGTH